MKTYEQYKCSGVEWIGKIPDHWKKTKVKHLFETVGGGTPSTENPDFWDGQIPWVSPKDMKVNPIVSTEDYVTDQGLENSRLQVIPQNSLLMVVRSGILRHKIPVSINTVDVTLNQDMKSFQILDRSITYFFRYLILGNQINLLYDWSKPGSTVESIEMDYVLSSVVHLPPYDERNQIVTYLD